MVIHYLRKIDLVYDGADSITLNWFNEVFYKLWYYSVYCHLKTRFFSLISGCVGWEQFQIQFILNWNLLKMAVF